MRRIFALLAFGTFVWAGCSSSGGDGGTPSAKTADQACTEAITAVCENVNKCSPLSMRAVYGDVATCVSRLKPGCIGDFNATGTSAKPSDADACINELKSQSCEALFTGGPTPACADKPGSLEDGKPCGDHAQCKSTFCAYDRSKTTCGKCAPKASEGGACVENSCPEGLSCVQSKCIKRGTKGAACDASTPCASTLFCISGKCVEGTAKVGDTCDTTNGPQCDPLAPSTCINKQCVKISLTTEGQECGIKTEGTPPSIKVTEIVTCEKGGYCEGVDISAGKFLGKCKAALKDGDACLNDGKSPNCLEPAECIDGKCKLPDASQCK